MEIRLHDEIRDHIARPVHGSGGFQTLLRLLQDNSREGVLTIAQYATAERIIRYARQYGEGGFQQRLQELSEEIESRLHELNGTSDVSS